MDPPAVSSRLLLAASRMPTFHHTPRPGCRPKLDGTIGHLPISASSEADYRWRLGATCSSARLPAALSTVVPGVGR
jgi:hypothetical protein